MVHFNESQAESVHSLQVLRVPAGMRYMLVMASESPVIVRTHWVGRRLWCAGTHCPACDTLPGRSVAYSVVIDWRDTGPVPLLLECTAREMDLLDREACACELGFGPGLRFEASRAKKRSPLRFRPVSDKAESLAAFAPVKRALNAAAVLGGYAPARDEESLVDYSLRLRVAVINRLERAMAGLE